MAEVTPALMYYNCLSPSIATIVASSAAALYPARRLRDPLRSRRWRSATGWTIVSGQNDKISVKWSGSSVTYSLTPGTYETGAAAAAMLQSVMTGNSFTITYSAVTRKLTIGGAAAFEILGTIDGGDVSNAVLYRAANVDFGIPFGSNTASGTSYVGSAVTNSRAWIDVALGDEIDVEAVYLCDHNLTDAGVVEYQSYNTPAFGTNGLTLVNSATLEGDDSVRLSLISTSTQYGRFMITDTANPDGYVEVGILYVGKAALPRDAYSPLDISLDNLGVIYRADQGASFVDRKGTQRGWSLSWKNVYLDVADLLEMVALIVKNEPFLFNFDTVDPSNSVYGYSAGGYTLAHTPPNIWDFVMSQFLEQMP